MRAGFRPQLVVMVKEPRAGRVKSRLARDVGAVAATQFFRKNMASTLARIGADSRWQTMIAVAPDCALASPMFWSRVPRLAQGSGELGERLARVATRAPRGPLILIGADVPLIRPSDIAEAFRTLANQDVVLGPSRDGGYWLVGLSTRARRAPPFHSVRWSSSYALADTAANSSRYNLRLTISKDDVDSGDDLARLGAQAGRIVVPPGRCWPSQ